MNTETGKLAADCLIDCLESYMEFVNITEQTLKCFAELPPKIELMSKTLIRKTRQNWQPILDKLKKDKQNDERKILNRD